MVGRDALLGQVAVNLPFATAAVRGSLTHTGLRDGGLLLKTVLTEALGGAAIRPWRLMGIRDGTATILGYSELDADGLRDRLALATPAVQQAVAVAATASVPALRAGQQLRFTVRLVPTVRQTGEGEIDAFLKAVRQSPEGQHQRAEVYTRYLSERLRGAHLDAVNLDGFRLAPMTRRHAGKGWAQRTFPVAEISGVLTVADADAFTETLTTGIGRQKGYGFGMVRIEAMPMPTEYQ
jgi:CRISPR-associated protein Cas6/Cse3/CasE subtype I-E